MTNEDYARLNGERLLHTVWVEENGQVVGIEDQTIENILWLYGGKNVIKIECQGITMEHKIRQIERWGD